MNRIRIERKCKLHESPDGKSPAMATCNSRQCDHKEQRCVITDSISAKVNAQNGTRINIVEKKSSGNDLSEINKLEEMMKNNLALIPTSSNAVPEETE